jgi:hypothetical protein
MTMLGWRYRASGGDIATACSIPPADADRGQVPGGFRAAITPADGNRPACRMADQGLTDLSGGRSTADEPVSWLTSGDQRRTSLPGG